MQSPMYSSVGGPDELNGGVSYNGAMTMRANMRNGNPNINLANEKGRNNAQRSEMLNTLDAKSTHMPKLMLAHPLQFQGQNNQATINKTNNTTSSVDQATLDTLDSKRPINSLEEGNIASLCETPGVRIMNPIDQSRETPDHTPGISFTPQK